MNSENLRNDFACSCITYPFANAHRARLQSAIEYLTRRIQRECEHIDCTRPFHGLRSTVVTCKGCGAEIELHADP